jgi:hypothetical protein
MSAFEKAGYIHLAGGRNSLAFTINGEKYFVSISDIQRVLRSSGYSAQIVRVVKCIPEQQPQVKIVKPQKVSFTLNLFKGE